MTGYAGAVLTLGCLLRLDTSSGSSYFDVLGGRHRAVPTHLGLWLFHLTAVLTVATYIHRDIRLQRGNIRS
ncbi:hypothetical protein [Embleya scabrispora]|uniref:hypothetical protein n=1 Tax=Embleya scabrispora TaxID=159449 RepID=UPI00036A3E09|nr:hypothetical protein [Embleya scabrispora]MYS79592.1 hypothetical protein [Streptomyces sp. SID5474]